MELTSISRNENGAAAAAGEGGLQGGAAAAAGERGRRW